MSSLITWGQLITYLTVFLFIYYAIVLLLFYRTDLLHIAKIGKRNPQGRSMFLQTGASIPEQTSEATLYNTVHELMEECKLVFQAAISQKLEKEQVIESLKVRIKKYPQLKNTAFQIAVTNHIEQELDNRCGIVLLEHDVESLWHS